MKEVLIKQPFGSFILIKALFLAMVMVGASPSIAQVGINNANPESSAILDLTDEKRGFLVPRMTSQRRMEIINEVGMPAEGLLVYDTDDEMFYYYNPDNNDGDNGSGDQNWQALSPMLFKDLRDDATTNGSGKTVFLRTIESHPSVKDIVFFQDTPGTYDDTNAPKLFVDGQVSIGADERAPSATGIHVEGESDFDSHLRVEGEVGQYTAMNSTSLAYQTTFVGYGTTPVGGIIMWSGHPTTLPPGWRLCNGSGSFTNELGQSINIPNLSGRFVLGHGGSYISGDQAGEERVTLSVEQLPSHRHEVAIRTSKDGKHTHKLPTGDDGGKGGLIDSTDENSGQEDIKSSDDGDHQHDVEGYTETTGSDNSHNNMPPYYVLAYIIRVQ